jgi:outer membrane protein insertion porin family
MTRICLFLLAFLGISGAQTGPLKAGSGSESRPAPLSSATEYPVDSIAVEGTRILKPENVIAASGLKIGAQANGAAFDAARDRLLKSGYFQTVSYRFKPSGHGGYELTFEVAEAEPLFPIRLEGLPAATQEAVAWLKAHDPLFQGRIPGTQPVLERTSHEIEQFLATRKSGVKVAGKVAVIAAERYEARFMPAAGLPNVAIVTFEGNKAIRDTELQNAIGAVAFGQPFTEESFRVLLDNQIRPLYEAQGYLRVAFLRITAAPSASVKGVDVHVAVVEGEQYKMGGIIIRGPMQNNSKHLLRVAAVPKMTTVDFDKINDAARRMKKGLKEEGYLDAEVTVDRTLDDAKKTVTIYFIPAPGPQYLFGKLDVAGLGLDGEAAIHKLWGVKSGDPFPADYPDYFLSEVKKEGYFENLGDTKADQHVDDETHVVDVKLTFNTALPAPKKKRPEDSGPIVPYDLPPY